MVFSILNCYYVIRIVIAGICGGVIGYERKNRGKGAGVRTHLIVAIGAALMMIISKYGFGDVDPGTLGTKGVDPSRIASQIVSGVGFLGAGMIYFTHKSPKGLTTAAGMWATAGVGMAIGSGMYVVGIATTVIVVACQLILHRSLRFMSSHETATLKVSAVNRDGVIDYIKNVLTDLGIDVESISGYHIKEDVIEMEFNVLLPDNIEMLDVVAHFRKNKDITGITLI